MSDRIRCGDIVQHFKRELLTDEERIEVRYEDENIWLTQKMMAVLMMLVLQRLIST